MAWWNSLSALDQIFAGIAIPFSVIMLIQTVLLFIGLGGDEASVDGDIDTDMDVDTDIDLDGDIDTDMIEFDQEGDFDLSESDGADLRLFSIRGIISFLVVMGWIGLLLDDGMASWIRILIAFASGFAALYLTAKIFQWTKKLQSSGNIRLQNAIGMNAQVYLTIPASEQGTGKINLVLQQRLIERDAVTKYPISINTGSTVKVVGIRHGNILVVEPEE